MDNIAHLDVFDELDHLDPEPRLDGHHGPCSVATTAIVQRPLWLTADEAEMLTLLCATSRSIAPGEERLFRKVGDLLRAFRR